MPVAGDVPIETMRASDCCVEFSLCARRDKASTFLPQYQHTGCYQGVSQKGPDGHEVHKIFQVKQKGHNSCRRRGR